MFVLSLVKKHYRLQFYMVSSPLPAPGLKPQGCWVIDEEAKIQASVWRNGTEECSNRNGLTNT